MSLMRNVKGREEYIMHESERGREGEKESQEIYRNT